MSVSRDATSGWYMPANSTEWTELLAGTGISNPDHLWLLQEASGNFADSIGSLSLGASAIAAYQQSETGWSRKFVTTTPQGGARGASVIGAPLAPLSTTSMMSLVFFGRLATVTAERDVSRLGYNGAEGVWATITSGHLLKIRGPSGTNTATGSVVLAQNSVVPIILQHDKTNLVQRLATPSETISPTYTAAVGTDASVSIGSSNGSGGQCPPGEFGYFATWQGSGAELSSAQITTLLGRLQSGPSSLVIARNRLVNAGAMGPLTKGSGVN